MSFCTLSRGIGYCSVTGTNALMPAPAPKTDLRPLAARLREAVARIPRSQNAVARELGISPGTLSSWLSGVYPPGAQTLGPLALLAGVTTDWILGLEDEPQRPTTEPPEEWRDYRRLGLAGEVGAGPGREVRLDTESDEKYAFRLGWFSRVHCPPRDVKLVKVAARVWGESMRDTISPGALLAVDTREVTRDTLVSGDVYLVWRRDEGMVCKRVFLAGEETLVLWSDNELYSPRVDTVTLTEDERLRDVVRGHVIWRGQELLMEDVAARRRPVRSRKAG